MKKYLFDVAVYRFFTGRKIQIFATTVQVDDTEKTTAFKRALSTVMELPEAKGLDFASVEMALVRVGDASR